MMTAIWSGCHWKKSNILWHIMTKFPQQHGKEESTPVPAASQGING
jgi:hypothetical protein